MSPKVSFFSLTLLFVLLLLSPFFSFSLPSPDPSSIQPFHAASSPPATIPAFPEQSNLAGCPLNLPEELFHNVKTACGVTKPGDAAGQLHRSRCCPVLASWLYAAYSATALSKASSVSPAIVGHSPTSVDLPLLPDDSETCVDDLGKALKQRGIELVKPNETCDVVYCYCGIRLHPLTCPEAFSLNQKGKLSGNKNVKRLERDCLSSSSNVNGFPGLGGCNKCLHSLHQLNNNKASNASKLDERTTKIRNKDCQLMGLTWLLSKNRKAYIHTVSAVIRAMMMSTDGSDPQSCTLTSDGMPLAVDSSDVSNQSSSIALPIPFYLWPLSLYLLCMFLIVPSGLF